MKKFLKRHAKKLAFILPITVLAIVFLYAYAVKPFSTDGEFCSVYKHAGICCPTCGMTRSAYCILIGDFRSAFYYHALFTVGFIPFTLALTGMGVNYYLGKRVLPLPKYRWLYFYACLILVILFAVFRNLTVIIL